MLPGITPALFGGGDGPGNDAFTVLLLHGDGPSGSTVFTDSSPAQHAVGSGTAAGAAITTLQAKFGGSSVALAPNPNGYLAVGTSSDFDFGTADFTIDWWEYRLDAADSRPVIVRNAGVQTYQAFLVGFATSGLLQCYASSNNAAWDILIALSMGAIAVNTWVHFALVRKGTTFYTFRNGVLIATATSALAFPASAGALCIGIWNITGSQQYNFNGYLDEFRISKGIARWTSNFIPPRQAYAPNYVPDVTTKLLMHFDTATGVTDSSPSAHGAATAVGFAGISGVQKKFGDASAPILIDNGGNDQYTVLLLHFDGPNSSTVMPDSSPKQHGNAAVAGGCYLIAGGVIGGAALVNPANGYIAFPNSSDWEFGAGDFTVDWWEYRNVAAGCAVARDLTTTYCPFLLHFGANGEIYMTSTGSNWDIANGAAGLPAPGFGPATLTVWNHFAVTRQGNTFRAFKNGVQQSTWTSSLAIKSNANPLCIGAAQNGQNVNSFMDELRISKGIARWTANFTPPTKPYGLVGGYLSYADNPDFNFGAGDFTIDCWAKVNAVGVQYALFGKNNAALTNGYGLYVSPTGAVQAYWLPSDAAFSSVQSAPLVTDANWHHYVLQRAGGLMQIYFDGTLAAQAAITPAASITTNTDLFVMGQLGGLNAFNLNGYIDELRVSKVARWSGNFSPPSGPYNPVTTLGPATHFLVTAPATASINSALNVTVQALDANNNATNNYTGTVHFTSTDGAAVLPANSILSSGVGTFAVTLKTLGSFTITATDTVTGTINGTSGPVSVLAVRNVAISASQANINLRTLHDALFPAPDASTIVVFTLNAGVKISSSGYGTPSLNVGSWPAGVDLTLYVAGDARGAGGNGGDSGGPNAQPGGTAIYTRVPIKLACAGTIWGGGGGGGGSTTNALAGGGGAGIIGGPGGYGVGVAGGQANPGTETAGGAAIWFGGAGGGPGQAGTAASPGWPGAAAGYSIDGIGYVTTGSWNGTVFTPGALGGDVRGSQG